MPNRRSILGGALALLLAKGKAVGQILQFSGASTLPAGVVLKAIDGGSTYYNTNGYTYAVALGWDSPTFFPIGIDDMNYDASLGTDGRGNFPLGRLQNLQCNFASRLVGIEGLAKFLGTGVGVQDQLHQDGTGTDNTENAATVAFARDEPTQMTGPNGWADGLDQISNTISNGRFMGVNFTINQEYFGNLSNENIDGTTRNMDSVLTYGAVTPNGSTKTIGLTGADLYWINTSTQDPSVSGNTGGEYWGGVLFNLFGNSSTSMSIPGSVPTSRTFTTNTNQVYGIGAVMLIDGGGGNFMYGTITAYNPSTGSLTATITLTNGSGTFSSWSTLVYFSADQAARGCRYGDMIDINRSWSNGHFHSGWTFADPNNAITANLTSNLGYVPANIPFYQYIENSYGVLSAGGVLPTPPQLNNAVWSTIIHGARCILYFNHSFISVGGSPVSNDFFAETYAQSIQGSNTISMYDQTKATNALVLNLAPVINSNFALGYVTSVSPSAGKVSGVEAMVKYYTGATTGICTANKFYIFAGYRGSGADTNIAVSFSIPSSSSASSVTRIYSDGVIGTASSNAGTTTRVQVGSTAWMSTGDTAIISLTSGISGLNGTFTPITVIDGTHFDIPLAFGGALSASGFGVVITTHTIVGSGNTFSDTWPNGYSIGIYRIN